MVTPLTRRVIWALSLVALGLVLVYISLQHGGRTKGPSRVPELRISLATAIGKVRFAEARLTGNFSYAPMPIQQFLPGRLNSELRQTVRKIRVETEKQQPSAQALAD